MDFLVERSQLDGSLKKLRTSNQVQEYLDSQELFNVHFLTPTFASGKFVHTAKEFGYKGRKTIKEFDGVEINDVVQQWFDKYMGRVKYFLRLDMGLVNLAFHYHGFVTTDALTLRNHCIKLYSQAFGKLDNGGSIHDPTKTTKYICGLETIHLNGTIANTKASLKLYCDKGIITNIYCSC